MSSRNGFLHEADATLDPFPEPPLTLLHDEGDFPNDDLPPTSPISSGDFSALIHQANEVIKHKKCASYYDLPPGLMEDPSEDLLSLFSSSVSTLPTKNSPGPFHLDRDTFRDRKVLPQSNLQGIQVLESSDSNAAAVETDKTVLSSHSSDDEICRFPTPLRSNPFGTSPIQKESVPSLVDPSTILSTSKAQTTAEFNSTSNRSPSFMSTTRDPQTIEQHIKAIESKWKHQAEQILYERGIEHIKELQQVQTLSDLNLRQVHREKDELYDENVKLRKERNALRDEKLRMEAEMSERDLQNKRLKSDLEKLKREEATSHQEEQWNKLIQSRGELTEQILSLENELAETQMALKNAEASKQLAISTQTNEVVTQLHLANSTVEKLQLELDAATKIQPDLASRQQTLLFENERLTRERDEIENVVVVLKKALCEIHHAAKEKVSLHQTNAETLKNAVKAQLSESATSVATAEDQRKRVQQEYRELEEKYTKLKAWAVQVQRLMGGGAVGTAAISTDRLIL